MDKLIHRVLVALVLFLAFMAAIEFALFVLITREYVLAAYALVAYLLCFWLLPRWLRYA